MYTFANILILFARLWSRSVLTEVKQYHSWWAEALLSAPGTCSRGVESVGGVILLAPPSRYKITPNPFLKGSLLDCYIVTVGLRCSNKPFPAAVLNSSPCILRPPIHPAKFSVNLKVLKWRDTYAESIRVAILMCSLKIEVSPKMEGVLN